MATQTTTWTDEVYRIHELERNDATSPAPPEYLARSLECFAPEDRPVIRMAIQRCVEQGELYDMEFPFTTALGRRLWIRTTGEPVLVDGRVVKVAGSFEDITERKQAEEAARENHLRLLTVLDAHTDPVYVADPTTYEVLYVNRALTEVFGPPNHRKCYEYLQHRSEPCPFCTNDRILGANFGKTHVWEFQNEINRRWYRCIDRGITWPDGRIVRYEITLDITDSKQTEAALRESAKIHRLMIDNSVDMISRQAADGTVLFATPSCERLTGYTAAELLGKPADFLVLTADRARVWEVIRHGQEKGDHYQLEHRLPRKDGRTIWVETLGRFIRDESGRVTEIQCNVRDITERKRAEQDRALSVQRMQALLRLNQMRDATLREVTDFALEEAVRLTQSTIGYVALLNDDESVLTMHSWSKSAMAECAIVDKPITYPVVTTGLWGEAVRQRRAIITNDYAAPNPLKKGYPEGHVALRRHMNTPVFAGSKIVLVAGVGNKDEEYTQDDVQQLTLLMEGLWRLMERWRAEEALREKEERYRAILQTAMDGFWCLDMEGRLLEVNETYCRMSGYSRQELLTMHVADLEAAETAGEQVEHSRRVMAQGEDRFETRHRRKDGSLFDAEVSIQYRSVDDARFVAFVRDITERKRAEEERLRLEGQLRQAQKMESVGRLAGGVAHDFNNMLNVILGYTELTLSALDPSDPVTTNLREISKAAERSVNLTRQLLAFARKQAVTPRVLDLNETVAGMLTMLRRLIGEDIELTWLPQANLWPVKVDPSQIDQILANLCVNSRDAITDVGKVTIETGNCVFDAEYCAAHTGFVPGEYVRLAVSDNGHGMDKETQARAFDPFFTTKEVGKGTGLGLSTVYGAVKQNNGFINVYSEIGIGTTFTIYFPRDLRKGEEAQTEVAAALTARGRETVLVVDDEPAILKLTTAMLEAQGYCVLTAVTPGEAMRVAREHVGKIDLLMSDVVMPEMNGRALAKNLLCIYPHLKRLFMSGYTADIIAHHGVLEQGVCFIQKPYSAKDLAAKVREALDSE